MYCELDQIIFSEVHRQLTGSAYQIIKMVRKRVMIDHCQRGLFLLLLEVPHLMPYQLGHHQNTSQTCFNKLICMWVLPCFYSNGKINVQCYIFLGLWNVAQTSNTSCGSSNASTEASTWLSYAANERCTSKSEASEYVANGNDETTYESTSCQSKVYLMLIC